MPPDISASAAYASALPVPFKAASSINATALPASTTAGAPVLQHASPVSLLDPSTGLVVLEFYDASGDETASLPTKKQLDLYRLNEPSPSVFEPAIREIDPPTPLVVADTLGATSANIPPPTSGGSLSTDV